MQIRIGMHLISSAGAANLDRLDVCQGTSLGVAETNFESFSVYPNPVTNLLTIELGQEFTTDSVIKLYDITGKLILKKNVEGSTQTLNMGGLHSGVYIVKISNANKNVSKRIIKQ